MIETANNKYDGVVVDSTTLPDNIDDFKKGIVELVESLANKRLY